MNIREYRTQVRKIKKYEALVKRGDGLTIKQQKEIIEAILQRPFAWTYRARSDGGINLADYDLIDWDKVKPLETLELVRDTGEIYLFKLDSLIIKT